MRGEVFRDGCASGKLRVVGVGRLRRLDKAGAAREMSPAVAPQLMARHSIQGKLVTVHDGVM